MRLAFHACMMTWWSHHCKCVTLFILLGNIFSCNCCCSGCLECCIVSIFHKICINIYVHFWLLNTFMPHFLNKLPVSIPMQLNNKFFNILFCNLPLPYYNLFELNILFLFIFVILNSIY